MANLEKILVNGNRIWMDTDDQILPKYYAKNNGIVDPFETKLLQKTLKLGMSFLEIGAYVGDHTVFMGKLIGPTGKGIAIEAAPSNYHLLGLNLLEYSLKNVKAIHAAASNYNGELDIFLSSKNHGDHRIYDAKDETTFRETKRDKHTIPCMVMDELNFIPELVKIDVQGAELAVFEGMKKILSSNIILFCEFWPYGLRKFSGAQGPEKMLDTLSSYGFSIMEIDEKNSQLKPVNKAELIKRFPGFGFINLLCKKDP